VTSPTARTPRKLTLSPTKISAFLRCRRFYWFIYVRGYRRRPHGALSLGASVHRSLEMIHTGPERPSVEDLLTHFEATWTGAGFANADEERAAFESAKAMVQRYHEEAPPVEVAPATLLLEKMLRVDRGHYILNGRLDRLDEWPDGALDVVDYKSGRSEVTEEQVREDIGLMAYETMVRHLYPDREVRVAIHALKPNTRVTITRTDAEAASVAAFLDEVASTIIAETEFRGVASADVCSWCDFEDYCPDWRGARPPN
jgi:putative RecB family exonuclease